jgi:KaiC/GvpD/RAD55 family RecA-like ATPase
MSSGRIQTGVPKLDELLGGGLLPGRLTVVLGATGIGKTQLGLQFAQHGLRQEGQRGIIFDLTARGDSQHHAEYALRLFDWTLQPFMAGTGGPVESVWDASRSRCDTCHLFESAGRRVNLAGLDADQVREWKAERNRKLQDAIRFFYGNFIHGVRRCVIDGVEPVDAAGDSFQFELFEYVYQQIIRKEADWVARDLFRAAFRGNAARVQQHAYDQRQIACVLLCTTHEVMLDALLSRPLQTGDVLSGANTIILMGKVRDGNRMGRALCVAKHRGSACDESLTSFQLTEHGLLMDE